MSRRRSLYLAVLIATTLFFSLESIAQKSPKNAASLEIKNIGEVDYKVLPGLAKIISIKLSQKASISALKYDEYEVLFEFIPMEDGGELLDILKDQYLSFKLSYRGFQIPVGPAYIKKMNLKVGTSYAMNLFQTLTGGVNIERYFYESKALENNLYQAYDDVVEGLMLTLNVGKDSAFVEAKKGSLSEAEQRALMDAELEIGQKNSHFVRPKFTRSALEYLGKHKALLQEYEAALKAISKMIEEERLLQEQEAEAEKKRQKALQDKIAALKGASTMPVVKETKIVRGCYYEVLPGLAEVTSIQVQKEKAQSVWNYDEHEVLFKFIPMEGHDLLEELEGQELEFVLYNRGERIPVGPNYIEEKKVKVGYRYAMTLYQKRDGEACTDQYTYESKGLDNDLFEAYPSKPFFDELKAKMDSLEADANPKSKEMTSKDSISSLIDSPAALLYKEALSEIALAKAERKKWRKICKEAIKKARAKARLAKKLKKQEKRNEKSQKADSTSTTKIQIGHLETKETADSRSIVLKPEVVQTAASSIETTPVSKRKALQAARKKAKLAKANLKTEKE